MVLSWTTTVVFLVFFTDPNVTGMRHCHIFPTKNPFPEVRPKDYLHQAADDLITILTKPPSPQVPILREGDPICNALLEIATQLKRVKSIDSNQQDAQQTRVQPAQEDVAQDTRVSSSTPPQMEDLQQQSTTPQQVCLRRKPMHQYNLRLRKKTSME